MAPRRELPVHDLLRDGDHMAGVPVCQKDDQAERAGCLVCLRMTGIGETEWPSVCNSRIEFFKDAHYGNVVQSAARIFSACNF